MTDPWAPVFHPEEEPNLSGAVHQALGSASLCWENMDHAGIFQSEEATAIAQGLLAFIQDEVDRARAEALKQVADEWQWGEWTMLTKSVKAGSVIGAAQVVTDWLRGRVGGGDEV